MHKSFQEIRIRRHSYWKLTFCTYRYWHFPLCSPSWQSLPSLGFRAWPENKLILISARRGCSLCESIRSSPHESHVLASGTIRRFPGVTTQFHARNISPRNNRMWQLAATQPIRTHSLFAFFCLSGLTSHTVNHCVLSGWSFVTSFCSSNTSLS